MDKRQLFSVLAIVLLLLLLSRTFALEVEQPPRTVSEQFQCLLLQNKVKGQCTKGPRTVRLVREEGRGLPRAEEHRRRRQGRQRRQQHPRHHLALLRGQLQLRQRRRGHQEDRAGDRQL